MRPNQLCFGNISGASTQDESNYLIIRPQYALSFNKDGCPNWVSWTVSASDIGNTPRVNDFRRDKSLPFDIYEVSPDDYLNTGFDRGHMCDCKDRTNSPEDESATFLDSNISPQHKFLNEHTWERFEQKTRDLVEAGYFAEVICGRYGNIGSIAGKITIPEKFWKIVRATKGSETLVLAVIMDNTDKLSKNWEDYKVQVSDVEKLTGYKFGI